MDINYNDFLSFIENDLNVQLLPYQKILLEYFCNGDYIIYPRHCGRAELQSAYQEYLSNISKITP